MSESPGSAPCEGSGRRLHLGRRRFGISVFQMRSWFTVDDEGCLANQQHFLNSSPHARLLGVNVVDSMMPRKEDARLQKQDEVQRRPKNLVQPGQLN